MKELVTKLLRFSLSIDPPIMPINAFLFSTSRMCPQTQARAKRERPNFCVGASRCVWSIPPLCRSRAPYRQVILAGTVTLCKSYVRFFSFRGFVDFFAKFTLPNENTLGRNFCSSRVGPKTFFSKICSDGLMRMWLESTDVVIFTFFFCRCRFPTSALHHIHFARIGLFKILLRRKFKVSSPD